MPLLEQEGLQEMEKWLKTVELDFSQSFEDCLHNRDKKRNRSSTAGASGDISTVVDTNQDGKGD